VEKRVKETGMSDFETSLLIILPFFFGEGGGWLKIEPKMIADDSKG